MRFLLQHLIGLLQDADSEVVGMTLFVLRKVLLARDIPIASPIALQLAERLRPLFDNVRLCAPHHGCWALRGTFVPCGFSEPCPGGLGAAGAELPLARFLSTRTPTMCNCSPFTSSEM